MKTERVPTYGLVGYPLGHSLSPLMHNAAFAALGVKATYQLFPLNEEDLDGFFKELKDPQSSVFGLNVTVPYKEKVLQYLSSLNPYAQKLRAVNTIVIRKDRSLVGYNTDGPGFLAHLSELGINPKDKRVALLGAGGASRAVLSVLCMVPDKRPKSIAVYDIDPDKAETLITDLSATMDTKCVNIVQSIDDLDIPSADILINATPVGMKNADAAIIDEEALHNGLFVYDLVYSPRETRLLAMAKRKGAKTSNGLGMLFYQGVLSFQHWADMELPGNVKAKMRKALEGGIQ